MEKCDICGNETEGATCASCKKIISKYNNLATSKLKDALRDAFDKENSKGDARYFKCVYTGISSTFNTTKKGGLGPLEDALVLTIDHQNPEDKKNSNLVVALHLINQMKSELPRDKFEKIVIFWVHYAFLTS